MVKTNKDIRDMVYGLDVKVKVKDGKEETVAINLDNGATTPPFKDVIKEIEDNLLYYGSIGRGTGQKSAISSEIYQNGRKTVKKFLGLDPDEEYFDVIYTNCTTDGMNKLASALIEDTTEDISVITTRMEHHANDLPWRMRLGINKVFYAETDEKGRLIINDIERLLQENKGVKYVCVTAASNVTGYVNDVHKIAKIVHDYGAKIIVDGAQIIAHREFRMLGNSDDDYIDFFVFSAHKMYSPFGGGVIIGLSEILNKHKPRFYGGGMVDAVYDYNVDFTALPDLYETGSPNYPGIVGMLKSMEILKDIGFDYIQRHEQNLLNKTIGGLMGIDGIHLYGDSENYYDRVGTVVFNIGRLSDTYVAETLANHRAIAVRHRKFCAHPYVGRLLKKGVNNPVNACLQDGMVRVSFGIYTSEEEIDILIDTVKKIALGEVGMSRFRADKVAEFAKRDIRFPNDRG